MIDLGNIPDDGIVTNMASLMDEQSILDAAISNDVLSQWSPSVQISTQDEIQDLTHTIEQNVQNGVGFPGGIDIPQAINSTVPQNPARELPSLRADRNDWYNLTYAYSLANSSFRPKLNFMFYVDFQFKPEFAEIAQTQWAREYMFMAYSASRPKMSFEYEDINQYNFRTKVLKNCKFSEIALQFYDDTGNRIVDFFRFIMTLLIPITRGSNVYSSSAEVMPPAFTSGHGMMFSGDNYALNDISHRGAIQTLDGGIFESITVTQTMVVPGDSGGASQVSYTYINPKIIDMELSGLDMESSVACTATMQFSFDSVIMPQQSALVAPRNPMEQYAGVPADFTDPIIMNNLKPVQSIPQVAQPVDFSGQSSRGNSASSGGTSGGYTIPGFEPYSLPKIGKSPYSISSFPARQTNDNPLTSILKNPIVTASMNAAMRYMSPEARQVIGIIRNSSSQNDPSKMIINTIQTTALNKGMRMVNPVARPIIGAITQQIQQVNRANNKVGGLSGFSSGSILTDSTNPNASQSGYKF